VTVLTLFVLIVRRIVTYFNMQFLNKKPSDRLGNAQTSERDIMGHAFYRRIDWDKIATREVQPPYKPKIVITAYITVNTIMEPRLTMFAVLNAD
jgi:hypothetical protein